MAVLSVDRLRKGRNYPHAAGLTSVLAAGSTIAGSNAAAFNAAPSTLAQTNGKFLWVHIVNLGTTNSYWCMGNSVIAPTAAAVGGGEIAQANGGELWMECEKQGTPVLSGIADTSNGNHVINWYEGDRQN